MIFGGLGANNAALNTLEVFDTTTGVWSTFTMAHARYNAVVLAVGPWIMVTGGS